MGGLLYLLTVSFLVALLTIGYGLLLRRTGWFTMNRLVLWLIVLLAFWLPLANLPEFIPDKLRNVMKQSGSVLPGAIIHRVPGALAHPTLPTRLLLRAPLTQPINAGTDLTWLYGMGVLLLIIRFGRQLLAIRQLIRRPTYRKAGTIYLVENPAIRAPFSFFRFVVLNPDLYAPDELDQILQHERWHCAGWHSIDRLASELLCIVLWPNPLVWWHGRLVQENLEYQVDQNMVNAGNNPRHYQYNLLTVSLLTQPIGLTNPFSKSQLLSRIRMMNRRRSMSTGLLAVVLFGMMVGLIFMIWPTAQHTLIDKPLSRLAVARGKETYFVIAPTTKDEELNAIKEIARHRNITLEIAPSVLRDSRHRIKQISFGIRPALPVGAVWTSLKAGAPYGKQLISPLGIRCDPAGCTVSPVDQTFPFSLRELARRETPNPVVNRSAAQPGRISQANLQYGLYETYFLDDMIESSFYGLRAMMLRIRPDKGLDLYDEAQNAVIIWDRQEISRAALQRIRVTDVMKLSVYKGDAAVARLGDERARPGLLILARHPNPAQAEAYAASRYLYR